jgi:hypothetical protein
MSPKEHNHSSEQANSWQEQHFSRRTMLRGGLSAAGLSLLPASTGASRQLLPRSAQTPAATTGVVAVYPIPDSRTASPGTEITFRGVTAEDLGKVTVVGTSTGLHSGILMPHSDGRGVSFVPDAPFRAEETVTVELGLPVGTTPTESFSFSTVRPVTPSKISETPESEDMETPPRSFRSRPDLTPPPIDVTDSNPGTTPGFIFVAPRAHQLGPTILDDRGEQVWFYSVPGGVMQANDFRVQQYWGRLVLTWCEGVLGLGFGLGHFVIRDNAYQEIAAFGVGNGYPGGDVHDFLITPDDTALICIYNRIRWDMRSVGGVEEDIVIDGIIQEIDIPTGRVLFEWHSLDHVGLDEARVPMPEGKNDSFDYFHVNSIEVDVDGNIIMSARHTFAVYKIDKVSGEVLWRLSGLKSSFTMGEDADFAYQHDARVHPNGQLSLFDNATTTQSSGIPARAIVLDLDTDAMTATLVREFVHPTRIVSQSQGNNQILSNGNSFVGWGSSPVFSEFSPDGELLFNGRFPKGVTSYRAYRYPWVGQPQDDPAIAVDLASGTKVTVYTSWNGATEVARWSVLAGPDVDNLEVVDSAERTGFETTITVETTEPFVAVQAEDASGNVLGVSPAIEKNPEFP